ncbi:MAG: hypothetical protein MI976_30245 [Pseudomonadales bacterium]|nr:hypothetical protein [Pseudomonadales bacterium]
MTRLVLTLLVIATLLVTGILFYPKRKETQLSEVSELSGASQRSTDKFNQSQPAPASP